MPDHSLYKHNDSTYTCRERLAILLHAIRHRQRTLVMGILNTTPDSFSDGGLYVDSEIACARAVDMVRNGADIIDVGGESTRPSTFNSGSALDPEIELRRVIPVISRIHALMPHVPISIDTYKSVVADVACRAGAVIVNDVSAMRWDSKMATVVRQHDAAVCLMHMVGQPGAIVKSPSYMDVVSEVRGFLFDCARTAVEAGIPDTNIILDTGIGFSKSRSQNLALIRRQREMLHEVYPLLVGPSRKSFIGSVLDDAPPEDRLEGTAAAVALCVANGAGIVRVHDVREMSRVVKMAHAITYGRGDAEG